MLPLRPGDRNGETLIYDQPTLQRREGDRHRMQAAPVTRAINVMISYRSLRLSCLYLRKGDSR
jgi:hypothetical protein